MKEKKIKKRFLNKNIIKEKNNNGNGYKDTDSINKKDDE